MEKARNILEIPPAQIKLASKAKGKSQKFSDPRKALESLGLVEIQRRSTIRQIFNVREESDNRTLIEIAIDEVKYNLRENQVTIYELEIEDKGNKNFSLLKHITDEVMKNSNGVLRKWPFTKLVTGKAIHELISEQELEIIIDGEGNLKSEAINILEYKLKGREKNRQDRSQDSPI